jgi:hypothetical protein
MEITYQLESGVGNVRSHNLVTVIALDVPEQEGAGQNQTVTGIRLLYEDDSEAVGLLDSPPTSVHQMF